MLIAVAPIVGAFVGLAVSLALGAGSGYLLELESITRRIDAPHGVDPDKWKKLTPAKRFDGGKWIGRLECIFAFASIWSALPLILVGWLAFKAASKWQEWSWLPRELKDVRDIDYAVARRDLGSVVFTRFLVGTLFNILAGFAGVAVARLVEGWYRSSCWAPPL